MSNIPIRDITATGVPSGTSEVAFDDGQMKRGTVASMADAIRPVASQSEAQAGSNNTKTMTPLRVKESFASELGVTIQPYSINLAGFAGKAVPSGAVVGDTDTQTLTSKTLVSPVMTGNPTAPTAGLGTNTTQLATTAFVMSNVVAVSAPYDYATRATVVSATIPAPVIFLRTAGYYAAGDGGAGLYARKVSLDANAFGFQSADGAWWQLVPVNGEINVRQTGAKGDNVNDDTAEIQAALSACAKIYVPAGVYLLSATLLGQSGGTAIGESRERVQFRRSTVYGPTLQFGLAGPTNNAGSIVVKGISFIHVSDYNNGATYVAGTSTSLTNKETAPHIAVYKGQNVIIDENRVTGAGGIVIYGCTSPRVSRNYINGQWDAVNSGLQEAFSGIGLYQFIDTDDSVYFNTEAVIFHNYIGGYGSTPSRSKTVGNAVFSVVQNYGPNFGIYCETSEGLDIHDNYIGGCHGNLILLSCQNLIGLVRIHHNFFDAARTYAIQIQTGVSTTWPNMVTIDHNTSQGYGIDEGFLYVNDTGVGAPSCANLTIAYNIGQQYQKSAVYISGAKGVLHIGNQWRDYNCKGSTDNNRVNSSGLYSTACYMIDSSNNLYGGSTNDPVGANSCQYGFSSVLDASNTCSGERAQNLGLAGGSAANITQTYPT